MTAKSRGKTDTVPAKKPTARVKAAAAKAPAKKKAPAKAAPKPSKPAAPAAPPRPAEPAPAAAPAIVTHEMIAQRAYQLWIAAGRPHGRDRELWLAAEAELRGSGGR